MYIIVYRFGINSTYWMDFFPHLNQKRTFLRFSIEDIDKEIFLSWTKTVNTKGVANSDALGIKLYKKNNA